MKKFFFDKNIYEIMTKASTALVFKLSSAVISFVLSVILTRFLGADIAGLYFLSLTCATIAASLGRLGLDNTVIKFVSQYSTNNDWLSINGVYRISILSALIGTFITSVVLYFSSNIFGNLIFAKPSIIIVIKMMAFAAIPISINVINATSLQGTKAIAESILILNVLPPIIAVILNIILTPIYGLYGAAISYIFSYLFTCLISFWFWKNLSPNINFFSGKFNYKCIYNSAIPLFFVMIFNLSNQWSSSIMLGVWSSSSNVAYFSVCNKIASLLSFILVAFNSIIAPIFSELYSNNDLKGLKNTAKNTTAIMCICSLPILLIICIFPKYILLIFGEEFINSYNILRILAIGHFLNVSSGSVGILLIMTSNENTFKNTVIYCSICTLIINYILISNYSIFGASLATAFSLFFTNAICLFLVRKNLGFWPFPTL